MKPTPKPFSLRSAAAHAISLPRFVRLSFGLIIGFCASSPLHAVVVLPGLVTNLVCCYDFEHPVTTNASKETDLGFSGTDLNLVNGGATMRTNDGAYPGSFKSLQTQQLSPTTTSNDDWKAGIYQTNGVASLSAFGSVAGITLMGWIKPTGTNPNLDTTTVATNDYYNAVGLFGLLSGTSQGHDVRALLEIITVNSSYQLVALGRRIDGGTSLTLAATNDWHALLPQNTWTHITATFDFDHGVMALYRNGAPLVATNTTIGNPWNTTAGVDVTSAASPAGIKIGGSYPQNTQEKNAFNGRFDDLMFFNKVLSASEVQLQYANFTNSAPPLITGTLSGSQIILSWPTPATDFALESNTNLTSGDWSASNAIPVTNGEIVSVMLPLSENQEYFRLKKL